MKRRFQEIGSGDTAVRRTLANMRRLARRDARDPVILAIVRTFQGTIEQKIYQAFRYVVEHMRYVSDPPKREYVVAPKYILNGRHPWGDCDDMSVALAALLLGMDVQVWFRVIDWKKDKDGYSHVYVLAQIPGQNMAIPLDPVMKYKGFGAEKSPVKRLADFPVHTDAAWIQRPGTFQQRAKRKTLYVA